ncbi:MAG: hypothetical protein JW829_10180, partial [Pirellulales bacterium]|nr:hypothetical protein [Pirellulales bacterium]
PGEFALSAAVATPHDHAEYVIEVADQQRIGQPPKTDGWADFRIVEMGTIRINQPGKHVVTVRSRDTQSWKAINLRWVKLTRAE